MKKALAFILVIALALAISSCGFNETNSENYQGSSKVESAVIIGNEGLQASDSQEDNTQEDNSQEDNSQEESLYSTGTVKLYAQNNNYDSYDMIFENNELVYVDVNDSNGFFGDLCMGIFGEDAPNPIEYSGMTHLTVESAKEFFEEKGFNVEITME